VNAVVSALLIGVFASAALALGLLCLSFESLMREYLPLHALYELGNSTLSKVDRLIEYCYELAELKSIEEGRCVVAEHYGALIDEHLAYISRIASASLRISVRFEHETLVDDDRVITTITYLVNKSRTALKKTVELGYLRACGLINIAEELRRSLVGSRIEGEFDGVEGVESRVRDFASRLLREIPKWTRASIAVGGVLPFESSYRRGNTTFCTYAGDLSIELLVEDVEHKPKILGFKPEARVGTSIPARITLECSEDSPRSFINVTVVVSSS